ncbi:MAG TPA: SPOR domain-containing protein [Gemmatimonadaceae bacterium]|nr:SPOR domain-containing protein [Gemmatimonadaceae bacterium]
MHRHIPFAFFALTALARAAASQTPATESVFVRAQQMVTAGQDSAGRAVIDSVVRATPEETPRYAEALFWRATLSKTAAGAERDYRRIVVEYALSPRAQESLFRLAQLEMTRGDRTGARAHLERLQREYPTGTVSARGSAMLAQLAFRDGDDVVGCSAVAAARAGLATSDIELRNQLDYYGPRCANAATRAAVRDSSAVASTPSAAAAAPTSAADGAPRKTASSGRTATSSEYSVQVAAFGTRAEAAALAKRLSTRGYSVRVVGERQPYRVRVGRYPTRLRADDAVRQMRRQNVRGIVVEAEPQ